MLVKNRDISLSISSGIMIERTYLTEKKLKGKNIVITESLTLKWKKLNEVEDGMAKFYLRKDQEVHVYFIINPDLIGNGQGLHYGKKIPFIYLCLFLGSRGFLFNKWIREFVFHFYILVFQYFSNRKVPIKSLNILYNILIILKFYCFQVHNLLS